MPFENTSRLSSFNSDINLLTRLIEEGNIAEFTVQMHKQRDTHQWDFTEDKWRDVLTIAIDHNSYECAKLLIENGANVHGVFDGPFHFGENLLGFAIQVGAFDIARLLLQHGAKAVDANNNIQMAKYNSDEGLLSTAAYKQLIENLRIGINPVAKSK